jgi:uncharacterized Tic20 family protein
MALEDGGSHDVGRQAKVTQRSLTMTTDPQSTEVEQASLPDSSEPEAAEMTEASREENTGDASVAGVPADSFEVSSESRNWGTFAHLSAFVMFLGVPSVLGPLVVWLAKKDDPYVEAQAKEALNFNISMLIYAVAAGISIILLIGLIALPAVFITWFVLVIIAAIRSADGEQYRYPFTIRLVS